MKTTADPQLLFTIEQQARQLLLRSGYLAGEPPLLALEAAGVPLVPEQIEPTSSGYRLRCRSGAGDVTAAVELDSTQSELAWRVSLHGSAVQARLAFPFLQALHLEGETRTVDFSALSNRQGQPMLRSRSFPAALVQTNGSDFLILLHEGALVARGCPPAWLGQGLPVSVRAEATEVYQGRLLLEPGGWREAFARIRQEVRRAFDLSEYCRADLAWYADQFVQHFTFLYGREILDLERGEFDLERFLDEGERDFGGYDGFLIWGVYPRIGLDERTQWDFYDDLPGGRASLRDMSRRARERGVRFFVPYKPWDRSVELHGQTVPPDEEMLAQLIVDTEADGVFLDTMEMITPAFRQAIDGRNPGVVFCSEGRAREEALEIVTGCWDQSPNRGQTDGNWSASVEVMPKIDLWRFVLPEHRLFVINRHAMGDDRLRIIQRGFFNGTGWVVWQDIFGLTLPYTSQEAALLKKCRTIFRENRQAVNCEAPVPLVETTITGLWANEFPGQAKRMWTFYNEGDRPAQGGGLPITARPGCHFVDVWSGREVAPPDGLLNVHVAAQSVGCVVESPCLIALSPDRQQVQVADIPGSAQVVLESGPERRVLPLAGGAWLPLDGTGRGIIKVLRDGEVLDQVCIGETPANE